MLKNQSLYSPHPSLPSKDNTWYSCNAEMLLIGPKAHNIDESTKGIS